EIFLVVDKYNRDSISASDIADADVAIDFSEPAAALDNIHLCFEANLPIVVGTTGWYEHLDEVKSICEDENQTMPYGSNFSIGVIVYFQVNRLLADAMHRYQQYAVQVEGIHHIHNRDAPSGTGITIAEGILENTPAKTDWVDNVVDAGEEVIAKPDE